MRINTEFELVDMAGEYIAVPVGQTADSFKGVVVLNEPTWFLLSKMDTPKTREELVQLLTDEYDVDAETAARDIENILTTLFDAGIVYE